MDEERTPNSEQKIVGQTFRAGVGMVIVNGPGQVLALERRDHPGSWQLPQGGLETGEEPEQAVARELFEETGLHVDQVRPLAAQPLLLSYELPPALRSAKTGRGQTQYWFFFSFTGPEDQISLGDGLESGAWRWTSMHDLAAHVVPFRRDVYRGLSARLAELLTP